MGVLSYATFAFVDLTARVCKLRPTVKMEQVLGPTGIEKKGQKIREETRERNREISKGYKEEKI